MIETHLENVIFGALAVSPETHKNLPRNQIKHTFQNPNAKTRRNPWKTGGWWLKTKAWNCYIWWGCSFSLCGSWLYLMGNEDWICLLKNIWISRRRIIRGRERERESSESVVVWGHELHSKQTVKSQPLLQRAGRWMIPKQETQW